MGDTDMRVLEQIQLLSVLVWKTECHCGGAWSRFRAHGWRFKAWVPVPPKVQYIIKDPNATLPPTPVPVTSPKPTPTPGSFPLFTVQGSDYTALSAEEKQYMIWENVISNTSSSRWWSVLRILSEPICPFLLQKGDQKPVTGTGHSTKKFFHPIGNVAKIKFVSSGDHPYTGIFRGANNGIARLSLAEEPVASVNKFIPAIAMKFLRDGVEAANVAAMYSLDGQKSWNFFANNFSTHVPQSMNETVRLLGSHLVKNTPYIGQFGLSDSGEIDENGEVETNVRFPYKLRLQPTGDIKFGNIYHGISTEDL